MRPLSAVLIALALAGPAVPAVVHGQGSNGPPPLLPSLPVPSSFDGLFAERDARAKAVLGFVACMEQTARLFRDLMQGSGDDALVCVEERGEWRGVAATLTAAAPGARVRRQLAMRPTPTVVAAAIDTAAVSRLARAMRRGLSAPLPGVGLAPFVPVALPQPTFTEVWFLPAPDRSRIVTGGDSVIQMTTDGNRELGHARRTPAVRIRPLPSAGPLVIESGEERLPLVSEIMAARLAAARVGTVVVRSRSMESELSRTGKWTHRARY